jgi:photosystem II stability/assembly factor-like uncharacterized protein
MIVTIPLRTRLRARFFAWALVVVVCAATASAQPPRQRGWLWQNPLPQGNAVYAVRFAADKLTGWAVGSDGVILRSDDGGYRWREQRSPTPVALYGLFVKDKKIAVAVGARGQILTTANGGELWRARVSDV